MDIPQESCVLPQALTVLRGQVAAGLLSLKKGRSWVQSGLGVGGGGVMCLPPPSRAALYQGGGSENNLLPFPGAVRKVFNLRSRSPRRAEQ